MCDDEVTSCAFTHPTIPAKVQLLLCMVWCAHRVHCDFVAVYEHHVLQMFETAALGCKGPYTCMLAAGSASSNF
jgi:hypothetical protein